MKYDFNVKEAVTEERDVITQFHREQVVKIVRKMEVERQWLNSFWI